MGFYSFSPPRENGPENAPAQLYIGGEICADGWGTSTDTEAARFREQLAGCGDVDVIINSPGGDVFAGGTIHSLLKAHPGRVVVKIAGIAASIASVIAMAGDQILIARAGYMMIHWPWTLTAGNAEDMERCALRLKEIGAGLAAIYAERTGKPLAEIERLLDAETYMNAESALEMGFADGIWATPRVPDAPADCMRGRNYTPQAIAARMGAQAKPQTLADLPEQEKRLRAAALAAGLRLYD